MIKKINIKTRNDVYSIKIEGNSILNDLKKIITKEKKNDFSY